MSKKRLLTVVASSVLAGALWQAPVSAEEKKDEPKHEEAKKEEKAAPKTAKKDAKKASPTEEAPKEQK